MIPTQSPIHDPTVSAQINRHPDQAAAPSIPGVQTAQALARFAGNQARYTHWLREFVTHGPAAAGQIRQAILHGSHDTAISLAHAFKGRTGMLGMNELQCIAMSLEMALRNREPTTLWMDELEQTVSEMSQRIAENLDKASP